MVVHALKPSTGRQRHADRSLSIWEQLGLQSEFQDSYNCYAKKPCLKKEINKIKTENNKSTTKTKSNQSKTKSKEPKRKKKDQPTNQTNNSKRPICWRSEVQQNWIPSLRMSIIDLRNACTGKDMKLTWEFQGLVGRNYSELNCHQLSPYREVLRSAFL